MPEDRDKSNKTAQSVSPARFVVRKNITRKGAQILRSCAYDHVVRIRELERKIQESNNNPDVRSKQATSHIRRKIKHSRDRAKCLYAASAVIDDMISNGENNKSSAKTIGKYQRKAADMDGEFMHYAKEKISFLSDGKLIRETTFSNLSKIILPTSPKSFGVATAVKILDSRYYGKEYGAKSSMGADQSSTYNKFEKKFFILS
jgi:hypothetical protein